MIEQLKTIRDALAFLDARFGWSPGEAPAIDALRAALSDLESSLAQYEAGDVASAAAQGFRDGVASVTQQEPVAWAMPKGDGTFIDVITPAEHARDEGSYTVPLFAHPVAHQPQARPDFTDEWTGYLKDGETPFERFLRERKDLNALTKLYQRVLEENERLKAQQPQAEDYKGWYCAHCQRGVDGSEVTFHEQHTVCGRVITDDLPPKQPQAEAVPLPPQVMVDMVPPATARDRWMYEQGRLAERDPRTHAAPQQAEAVPVVDRVYEAAKRLVDHADFQLGGVLSAKSKTRDIPSNAASKVKARHLASLRDALAKTPQQAEAVPQWEQLHAAWLKVGADLAGLNWEDFAKAAAAPQPKEQSK